MCQVDLGGERVPAEVDAACLQRFLFKHDDGSSRRAAAVPEQPPPVVSSTFKKKASPEEVDQVKRAQRSSAQWRLGWENYCDDEANGMRDPSQLSSEFLQKFLDRVAAESSGTSQIQ